MVVTQGDNMFIRTVRATKENVQVLIDNVLPKMTERQKEEYIRKHLENDYKDELLFVQDWEEEFGSTNEYIEE